MGLKGQEALRKARVLCVGAGGLGSPLALYLAAAGIGRLGLVDFDTVELSNLQRQILYSTDEAGMPKTAAAKRRLAALNPEVDVIAHQERLTADNAAALFERYDIVADGSDNFSTRYLVNDACLKVKKPNVHGSVSRFEGRVVVFAAGGSPCYRCLYPEEAGLAPSCAEAGVLGVLPGIIGSIMALETLKLVLNLGKPLKGRLLLLDGLALSWKELKVKPNPSCPLCAAVAHARAA